MLSPLVLSPRLLPSSLVIAIVPIVFMSCTASISEFLAVSSASSLSFSLMTLSLRSKSSLVSISSFITCSSGISSSCCCLTGSCSICSSSSSSSSSLLSAEDFWPGYLPQSSISSSSCSSALSVGLRETALRLTFSSSEYGTSLSLLFSLSWLESRLLAASVSCDGDLLPLFLCRRASGVWVGTSFSVSVPCVAEEVPDSLLPRRMPPALSVEAMDDVSSSAGQTFNTSKMFISPDTNNQKPHCTLLPETAVGRQEQYLSEQRGGREPWTGDGPFEAWDPCSLAALSLSGQDLKG
ncbi:hypothetical protein E2C01_005397 [Portunus trituberculatus]|uniref:Uncharacterized protein n=1 Tax=Portunus trituberculatus TaxID=210409 RepID=A0A5B7CZ29_PORTR|nr:hypothetical protein [Portunus trituberculatus]